MKHILRIVAAAAVAIGAVIVLSDAAQALPGVPAESLASAADTVRNGVNRAGGADNSTNLMSFIEQIINILLFIIGAVAVLAIIIGGIRYVVSGGDPKATTAARDTILYAVIGLIVAFMAYAIVKFIVNQMDTTTADASAALRNSSLIEKSLV